MFSNLIRTEPDGTQVIEYNAGPSALSFFSDDSRPNGLRINALWGPIRCGKSTAGVQRIFQRAMALGTIGISLKAIVIRDTFENLRDSTLKTWLEWFPDHSPFGYYSESKKNYYLQTPKKDGSNNTIEHEIQFRYGQNATDASKYLSTEYGLIDLEEVVPAYTPTGLVSPGISEEVFDMAIMRACQRDVIRPEINVVFNPPSPSHWANRRLLKVQDPRIKCFFFPREENERNLRPGFYEELEQLLKGQDSTIARFLRGEIVAVYPGVPVYSKVFNTRYHVKPSIKYIQDKPLVLLWDNPPTPACLVTQIDYRGRWNILKEFQGGFIDGKIMETIGQREFCDLIKPQLQSLYHNAKYAPWWADPALKSPSNTETATPLQILQEKFPGVEIRFGAVDNFTRQESVRQKLSHMLMGELSVAFSAEGCPLLIEGMQGGYRYNLNSDGTSLSRSEPVKNEFSHVCNALEYGCSGLFPAIRVFNQAKHGRPLNLPPSAMSA